MAQDDESPAVRSIKKERSRLRAGETKSELQKGLEDTFPASDPIAATETAIPGRSAAAGKATANRPMSRSGASGDEFPLVDEALEATQARPAHEDAPLQEGEMHALKAEVARLRETVAELASGTTRVARARAKDAIEDVETRIRERPWNAIGIAALLGFILGLRR